MTYIACDLTLTEDIEKLFKAMDKERPDGVDIFINAAGMECQTKTVNQELYCSGFGRNNI